MTDQPLHDRYAALRPALIALVQEIGHPDLIVEQDFYGAVTVYHLPPSRTAVPPTRWHCEVRMPMAVQGFIFPAEVFMSGLASALVAPALALIAEYVRREGGHASAE